MTALVTFADLAWWRDVRGRRAARSGAGLGTSYSQFNDQGPVVGDVERRRLAPSCRWNPRRTVWIQQEMIELHTRSCCGVGGSAGEHAPTGDEPEQPTGQVEVAEQEPRSRQLTQGPLGLVQLS